MLQDEERLRVAAELHDGLGQNLAIIKNRALTGLRDQTNLERVREQLEEITATATSSSSRSGKLPTTCDPTNLIAWGWLRRSNP